MEHKIRATFYASNDAKSLDQDSGLLLYFTDVNKEKMDKITAENEEIKAKNDKIWGIAAIGIIVLIVCFLVMATICATGILAIVMLIMIEKCDDIADYFYAKFSKAEYCLQNYDEMIYVIKKCSDENTANYVVDNRYFAPICNGTDHAIHINIKNGNIKIDNEMKDNVILIDGNMREDKNYAVSMYMNDHTKCLLEKLWRKNK